MRLFLRILGLLLLAAAAALLVRDLAGSGPLSSVGDVWYGLSPATLNLLQAGIQRHVAPALWDDVVLPILLWPAVPVLAVPGLLLAGLSFRPRRTGG